jgi:hypothetical protein
VSSATKAFASHLGDHLRMEPGPIVQTELAGHVTGERARAWLAGAQPRRVNLSHVRILPTQEQR